MSTSVCDAFYHGVASATIICPHFCCGNQTFRYCCSDCNLHYPFSPSNCEKTSDSSHIAMVVITVILVGVAVILLIATSLRYTRFGQKLCFHATGRRHHLETSTENASQLAARADVQDPVRTQDPRMSPYSLIPPSLLPPLPTYDDVSSDVPPPAFEEAHDSPPNTENMTMTSIIPLPQPAIIHDPECTPAPQRPPPAYTSFSSPPTSGPPAEQRESQRQR